jgi:16S rRNA (uracil1498-N3)-methyltransferase
LRVVPLLTERCGVRLEGKRLATRLVHWRGVSSSACEQCGRNRVPVIEDARTLAEWLETIAPSGVDSAVSDCPRIVFDPLGGSMREAVPSPPRGATILIGPEGGLSETELAQARERGFVGVRLGPRVMRTETAGIAALAALQALWGDLGS